MDRIAIVGRGRLGSALTTALRTVLWTAVGSDVEVSGPFGRGFDGVGHDVVILAVPDAQIASAAAAIIQGPIVGHCAGSLGVTVLGEREAFAFHPLMTVTAPAAAVSAAAMSATAVSATAMSAAAAVSAAAMSATAVSAAAVSASGSGVATMGAKIFLGAGAAVAGNTPRALTIGYTLATALGMRAFEIHDRDRAAYHAAASLAANFLITLEDAAETLLAAAGGDRAMLVPLVRAAVENWAALGGPAALTGPIARGDDATVARQRAAVSDRAPQLIALFDALAEATRALAARR